MSQPYRPRPRRRKPADSGRRLLIIVLVIVTSAGMGVFGCGGFLVWQFLRPVETPTLNVQTPEEKRAELHAAFSAETVGVPDDELQELEHLFEKFTSAAGSSDGAAFRTLVDTERFHQEMHRSGQMPRQLRVFDLLLQDSLEQQIWLPLHATRYNIVHVRNLAEPDEAVVYVFFWDARNEVNEMRVWVTRSSGDCKIFDWELLQFGMRASLEMALFQTSGAESYNELFQKLNRAERCFQRGNRDQAARCLRQGEDLLSEVMQPLREQARMHILSYWMSYGYYSEAAALGRTAVSPEATPAALYAQIVDDNSRNEHEPVLELCRRYEEALGPGPIVALYRAAALTGLKRRDAANAARAQYLQWDPGNADVLAEFALELDDKHKSQVLPFLEAAADPLDVCRTLASRFTWVGDQAGLSALLSYLEDRESASAQRDYVNGLLLELQGRDEQAAEMFLKAVQEESDETLRSEYLPSFIDCMTRLGEMMRAYELSPDAEEAFAYLANGDVDDDQGAESPLRPDILRKLLEAHRRRSPNDPWLAYHLGNLCCRDGNVDEALRVYKVGLDNLANDEDGDVEWALEFRISDCLAEAGRWREIYERGDSPTDSFEELAGQLQWREQFDILRQLVELHRQQHPEDALGSYYAGRLALHDERFDDADRLLSDAWAGLDADDFHRYQVRSARVDLRIAAGRALEAYGEVPPARETFEQLAAYFTAEQDLAALDDLIRLRRQDAPDDTEPLYWQVNSRFRQHDYAGVLKIVAPLDPDVADAFQPYRRREWDSMHLRSLLRSDHGADAVEFARDIFARQSDPKLLIVALACTGQNDEAMRLLEDHHDSSYRSIYDDSDAGTILSSEAFRPAREHTPPTLPAVSTSQLVVLLEGPVSLSTEQLRAAAAKVFGADAGVEPLNNSNDPETETFLISTTAPELLVVIGKNRFQDDLSQLRQGMFADTRRWEAIRKHQAWCACCIIDSHTDDPALTHRRRADLRCFTGWLFGAECLALYDGENNRVLIPSDGLPDLLLDPDAGDLKTAGESLWLYRDAAGNDREWILQERIRRLLHGALRQWMASDGDASLEVAARISAAPVSESVRIQIATVERAPYSGWTLTGHLLEDSQLVPWLHTGEPIQLKNWAVTDWTLTTDSVTTNARTEAEEWWKQVRGNHEAAHKH